MKKVLWISVLFLLVQSAWADPGTSHIIKAKITFKGKERVGYFVVWGYLYLTNDSLSYDVPKFTQQAKRWVYGDTILFYSEMFFIKAQNLTVLPLDKSIRVYKNDISKIIPLALVEHNRWVASYTKLQSIDKEWIFGSTHSERERVIKDDALCTYSVLYFTAPDSATVKLVIDLERTIEKDFESGNDNSVEIERLIEQLRKRKVLILTHCSPT